MSVRQTKTLRLVLVPKDGQEEKIRAFREIVARNNLTISDVLYEKVEEFLRQHNWPPGNSQTLLKSFGVETKTTRKCVYHNCNMPVEFEDINKAGEKILVCRMHHESAKKRRLLKGWKQL